MIHRKRVEESINFGEPDRIPIDMWGTDSRLVDDFYFKVLEHLGWDRQGELECPGKTAQYVDYRLSGRFDCDFRHIVAKRPVGFESWTPNAGLTFFFLEHPAPDRVTGPRAVHRDTPFLELQRQEDRLVPRPRC